MTTASPSVASSRRAYVDMYGEMGRESNTMIFNKEPADFGALVSQATAVFSKTGSALGDEQGSSSWVNASDLLASSKVKVK